MDLSCLFYVNRTSDNHRLCKFRFNLDKLKVLNEINDTPNKMHFIEVHMDVNDAPEKLNKVAQAFSNQNS